jgi:hypothetical protein
LLDLHTLCRIHKQQRAIPVDTDREQRCWHPNTNTKCTKTD